MPKNKFSTGAAGRTSSEQKAAMPEAAEFRAHIREEVYSSPAAALGCVLRQCVT